MSGRRLVEGRDYDHEKPPFELPGDGQHVALVSGEPVSGARGRVLWLIYESARLGVCWHLGGGRFGVAGRVPTWALRHAWAGGTSGDRRARDLREVYGLPIESEEVSTGTGRGSSVGVYWWDDKVAAEGLAIRDTRVSRSKDRPAPASARARRSPLRSGPRSPLAAAPVSAPVVGPALAGVAVAVRWPGEDPGPRPVELEATALAPSAALRADVVAGRLSVWDADARYRAELSAMRSSGALAEALRALDGCAVVCPRLNGWVPGTMLRLVVEGMGVRAA